MMDRAGMLKTNLPGEAAYKSFTPAPVPTNPPVELDNETVELTCGAAEPCRMAYGYSMRAFGKCLAREKRIENACLLPHMEVK